MVESGALKYLGHNEFSAIQGGTFFMKFWHMRQVFYEQLYSPVSALL